MVYLPNINVDFFVFWGSVPFRELTCPHTKALLKMLFLFPRWDNMLVSWEVGKKKQCIDPMGLWVCFFLHPKNQEGGTTKNPQNFIQGSIPTFGGFFKSTHLTKYMRQSNVDPLFPNVLETKSQKSLKAAVSSIILKASHFLAGNLCFGVPRILYKQTSDRACGPTVLSPSSWKQLNSRAARP